MPHIFDHDKVSLLDRCKAASIIRDLRTRRPREALAKALELNPSYVSFAEHNTKQNGTDRYMCPNQAIRKILQLNIDIR